MTPPLAGGIPSISIDDAAALEGGASIVFPVSLSAAASAEVGVNYASADGSANANDNSAVSG